jgi:hypothetical protein
MVAPGWLILSDNVNSATPLTAAPDGPEKVCVILRFVKAMTHLQ